MIGPRSGVEELPERPHGPIACRPQAENRVMEKDGQSRRRPVDMGLPEVGIVVLDQGDGEGGSVRQQTQRGEKQEADGKRSARAVHRNLELQYGTVPIGDSRPRSRGWRGRERTPANTARREARG